MAIDRFSPGVHPSRIDAQTCQANFQDLHAPFDAHEARVAADRCYFCHDAPCTTACPTEIDIPLFIRQIATGMPEAAAKTILAQNILGGMCARVCPTETLCEQACVRNAAEDAPVQIGRLQRFATDQVVAKNTHPFTRNPSTGKKVAVVGAGPAGLACAHRLAMRGHDAVIYESRPKPGGLNEYGIASYKSTDGFAGREVNWLLSIGGITVETGQSLGRDLSLDKLRQDYDAVFLGIGLAGVNTLELPGAEEDDIVAAVDFIAALRQSDDLTRLPIGRDVVVIGGGMTAIDTAVQARLLGALNVTLVYRRSRDRMKASTFEQDLAASKGVRIITNAQPVALHTNGAGREVEFAYTHDDLTETGQRFRLQADQIFCAIGQRLTGAGLPTLDGNKIAITGAGRTSVPGVWAGGDCAAGGEDLTVTAVAQGRDAAEDIHQSLMS